MLIKCDLCFAFEFLSVLLNAKSTNSGCKTGQVQLELEGDEQERKRGRVS